ncbi:Hypothetical protein BRZCDTV_190 [Brazilian cedratvirus IHUMI]|uniref:Uncharacterized protein n=1 Tax=Brazilian cedratvirus IHUMI TaxID=2126980 RepID=A0A2R8FDT5_9VIRU|nr:Hypothetical protein BRZCDTV_190 [Brazilian cedratvirus IHUMI]
MSSFQEKVDFLLQVLSKVSLYKNDEEECTMVSVNFSDEKEACPRLFQVIKQKDGYLYQLLEEGTHQRLETGRVSEEELVSLLPKMEGGREAELTWGPYYLF